MAPSFLHIVQEKGFFMRKRSYRKCVVSIFILAFFSVLLSERLWQMSEYQKYRSMTLKNSWYRAYFFDESMEKISGNLTGECKALYRNVRDEAQFFWLHDGKWEKIGVTHPMQYTMDHFTGCRFGLFMYSTEATGGKAAFSNFIYHCPDGTENQIRS